jgi:phosphoadenosine phosphosulfate reductase
MPTATDISPTDLASVDAMDPQSQIAWAFDRWADKLALTCSFGGAGGMVLLDMAMKVSKSIPVLVLDTGLLFDETYGLIDYMEWQYKIQVVRVKPKLTVDQQAAEHGAELWKRDPDACCRMRKVEPFADSLKPFASWITAIRRDQSATRESTQSLEFDEGFGLWKLCPLARWSGKQVQEYVRDSGLMINPLLLAGYTSIGCTPCTAKPTDDGTERSGRWAGFAKVECGLHKKPAKPA